MIPTFFSSEIVAKFSQTKAKIITSFSMFYDLEDPIQFAKEINESLAEDGVWIFEQSYLPQMIETNSYDTICHEHLEFYSLKQIDWILKEADLKVIDVELNNINGGSFSVTAAKINSHYQPKTKHLQKIRNDELALGLDSIDVFNNFKINIDKNCKLLMKFLIGAKKKNKNGSYTPGTLIPLISEEEVLKRDPDYLLILPWHFKDFFLSLSSIQGRTIIFPLPEFEIIKL